MLQLVFNLGVIVALLRKLDRKVDAIMATLEEQFTALADQTNKVYGELSTEVTGLKTKVDELLTEIANGPALSDAAQAKLDEVKANVQKLDDIVPDPVSNAPEITSDVPSV